MWHSFIPSVSLKVHSSVVRTMVSTSASSKNIHQLKNVLSTNFKAVAVHPREEMIKQYPFTANNVKEHYLFSEESMKRLEWDMMLDREKMILWSFITFKEGCLLGNTQGFAHGGLLSAIFDGALGSLFTMIGESGFTANLNINYCKPVTIPSVLMLRAEVIESDGRKLWIGGELTDANIDENGYGCSNNFVGEEENNGRGMRNHVYVNGKGLFLSAVRN